MTIQAFIEKFEDSIEGLEPGTVTPDAVLKDLEQWDSLAVLTTIAMADAECEAELTADDLAECRTVEDLYKKVTAKRRGGEER